jgi:hypothetical protein
MHDFPRSYTLGCLLNQNEPKLPTKLAALHQNKGSLENRQRPQPTAV